MKNKLIILLLFLSGCYSNQPTGTITSTGKCNNGEREYCYEDGRSWRTFYDSCEKWKVGDNIFTTKK